MDVLGKRPKSKLMGKFLLLFLSLISLVAIMCRAYAQDAEDKSGDIVITGDSRRCNELQGFENIDDAIVNRHVSFVVLGELHGTAEIPEFFGDLVCNVAMRHPVNVDLELSEQYQPDIDAFMHKTGDQATVAFLRSSMWLNSSQDGRSSEAMLRLLMRLKNLRRIGLRVKVYASQPVFSPTLLQQGYSELATAYKWMDIFSRNSDAVNLILVGTFHAGQTRDDARDILPASGHLPASELISFRPEITGGSAWNCSQPAICGPHAVGGINKKPRFIGLLASSGDGFNGSYSVGRPFSSSPPANVARATGS